MLQLANVDVPKTSTILVAKIKPRTIISVQYCNFMTQELQNYDNYDLNNKSWKMKE